MPNGFLALCRRKFHLLSSCDLPRLEPANSSPSSPNSELGSSNELPRLKRHWNDSGPSEGECPVCRRPLDDESRAHAEEVHQHDQEVATAELEALDVGTFASVASTLRRLVESAEVLGDAIPVPDGEPADLDALTTRLDGAKEAFETALKDAGQAELVAANSSARRKRAGGSAKRQVLGSAVYKSGCPGNGPIGARGHRHQSIGGATRSRQRRSEQALGGCVP